MPYSMLMVIFDEVACSALAAVQVTACRRCRPPSPDQAYGAPRRMLGGQRGEDGVDALNDSFVAADHQADNLVPPPRPRRWSRHPDSECPSVWLCGPADVIVVKGVATIDDRVVPIQRRGQGIQRRIDYGGGHHQPDRAGRFQFLREVFERRSPRLFIFGECLHGFRLEVVDHALVAGPYRRRTMLVPLSSPIIPSSMWFSFHLKFCYVRIS